MPFAWPATLLLEGEALSLGSPAPVLDPERVQPNPSSATNGTAESKLRSNLMRVGCRPTGAGVTQMRTRAIGSAAGTAPVRPSASPPCAARSAQRLRCAERTRSACAFARATMPLMAAGRMVRRMLEQRCIMTDESHRRAGSAQGRQPETVQALDAAATSRDISQYLGADHARLDAIIPALLAAIDSASFETGRERFAEFSSGLRTHIQIEEDLLFPAFEQATGTEGGGPAFVMRGEHVEIRRLLTELGLALEECDATGARRSVRWLIALLRLHNAREERVLYPMADRALADDWKQAFSKRCQEL